MLNRQIAFNDDFAQKLIKQASRHHRPFKMHVEYLIELAFKVVEEHDEDEAHKASLDEAAPRRLPYPYLDVVPHGFATMDPSLIPVPGQDS